MRQFISKNPSNHKILGEFKFVTDKELQEIINRSIHGYQLQKSQSFKNISEKLNKLSTLIDQNYLKYAKVITTEIGKPINQSIAEIKKCSAYCRYYAENGQNFRRQDRIKTEAKHSYVQYEPIGTIYSISPFNFPFWLCFKPIIPMITLGNAVIHRPSDSTGLCGLALEELFKEAGFDSGEFQNIFSNPNQLDQIMSHQQIQGVSFTGSTKAGGIIGSIASKYLKRSVLELGGSDPFCVLLHAKIDLAVELAIRSRSANCGQVCFSAKRFIINEAHYDKFKTRLIDQLSQLTIGNPQDEKTQLGPLAREDLLQNLINQINNGINQGANLLYGGKKINNDGNYFMPTVIETDENNILAQEETFGPLFTLIKAKNNDEILRIANNTQYGLGAVVVSENTFEQKQFINELQAGLVFVNEVVKSDQRLPSGGIKQSGYGRECGYWGVQNFANIKTVWIQ